MASSVPPEPVGSVSPLEHPRRGPATSPTSAMGGRVLVLNATYEPINVCTVRRAVVLLLKERAELVERGLSELHSETSTLARPVVIRLVPYVNVPRGAHRRKIARRAGPTSSPGARHAIAASPDGCRARPACTRDAPRARHAPTSSSTWPARRS